ncbi:MAG TPA: M3 family oligoendopeptidase [Firmicutes bacterium]|nr:M3 family oligoendopeptidase [Bacillota bacterium]
MVQRFRDFPYERPDFTAFRAEFLSLVREFVKAATADAQDEILGQINARRNYYASLSSLAHIRYTLNTKDQFYTAEQEFFDETDPLYEELITDYYRALVASPHREELSRRHGRQLFTLAEMALRTFSPAVIALLQQENKLASSYKKLLASAAIPFDGEKKNLSQLVPYQQSPDRTIRREAAEARYRFFAGHREEFDEIYARLVAVRTEIAARLGFENFIPLAYLRRSRSDYTAREVAAFRREIKRHVVPLASALRTQQAERLGLPSLKYYDEALFYPEGNPAPAGTPEEILAQGQAMYQELSPETGDFFRELTERELLDLLARAHKAPGGYCDYLAAFQAPFIFANFNGTAGDIDVLTHEAGHAFQVWLGRHRDIPEYHFATMEAAEIPSMGMEFFTRPYMELFFGSLAPLYRHQHLSEAVLFLPYGALVDHFQHEVFARPGLTSAERRRLWHTLEQIYLPHRDYDGHPFLLDGGYWYQQGHIFEVPFYYIDYCLAGTCVFQLWQRAFTARESAWQDYLALCRAGGSLPLLELLSLARLSSPFAPGTVKQVTAAVRSRLEENRP